MSTGGAAAGRGPATDPLAVARRTFDRGRAWARTQIQAAAAHPARLAWTLLLTLAYFAAERPIWSDAHGLWASFHAFFLRNAQVDYGEGPLLNQEFLLYHGRNIYTLGNAPPFAFGNYPPGFPLVASLLMHIHAIGMTFMAGRLTSSLAVMGTGIVVGLIVLQATGQVLPAFLAAGILLTFPEIHDWGPYNRVDSLAMFWSVCTVFVALRYAGSRKAWWIVPFAVLTVYTRQSDVDGILAAFAYLLWRDWRRCLAIGAGFAAAVLAIFVGMQIWSHGAFYLDTVVFNENAWNWNTVVSNWTGWARGVGRIPFRLALAGAAAGLLARGRILWPVWLAASVGVFATIGKVGSSINYFFPLEAATAAAAGLFVGQFRSFFRRAPLPLWPLELVLPAMLFAYVHGAPPGWLPARLPLVARLEAAAGRSSLSRSAAAAEARSQAAAWAEDARLRREGLARPARPLVTPGNVQQLIRFYQGIPGPVLALDFPRAEVVQAGKQMQWQPFEYGVVYQDGTWSPAPFVGAIDDRYYGAIVLQSFQQFMGYDGGFGPAVVSAVQENYHQSGGIQGLQVWRPDGPPRAASPPVGPVAVPRPLPDLLAALGRGAERLPRMLLAALFRPGPIRVGGFEEIPLGPLANVAATAEPGRAAGPGWDGAGGAFEAGAGFPAPGTLHVATLQGEVPFRIPPAGPGRLAALAPGTATTVALPPGDTASVWLLESAARGPVAVPVRLEYRDGRSGTVTVTFGDWCSGVVLPPEYPAFWAQERIGPAGSVLRQTCGLFALRVAADPAVPLRAVVLGPSPWARVVALTLQPA